MKIFPEQILIKSYVRDIGSGTAQLELLAPVPNTILGKRVWEEEEFILFEVPVDGSNINWSRWKPDGELLKQLFTLWQRYSVLPLTLPFWDNPSLKLENGAEIFLS